MKDNTIVIMGDELTQEEFAMMFECEDVVETSENVMVANEVTLVSEAKYTEYNYTEKLNKDTMKVEHLIEWFRVETLLNTGEFITEETEERIVNNILGMLYGEELQTMKRNKGWLIILTNTLNEKGVEMFNNGIGEKAFEHMLELIQEIFNIGVESTREVKKADLCERLSQLDNLAMYIIDKEGHEPIDYTRFYKEIFDEIEKETTQERRRKNSWFNYLLSLIKSVDGQLKKGKGDYTELIEMVTNDIQNIFGESKGVE